MKRALDDDREAMQQLLAALVAVPSENPPATGYAPCVELLVSTLEQLAIPYEMISIPSPPEAPRTAIRAWLGTGTPVLYFHGHYDVVPAQSPSQFAPRLEGDTLFGRGSSDMKSGLVAMLYAARALQRADVSLNGRLELLFVPDEETGGTYGSGALAAGGRLGTDGIGMLLPEPTSGVVWNANRGAITLEISVKGRAAHVGLQHQGINAVERALILCDGGPIDIDHLPKTLDPASLDVRPLEIARSGAPATVSDLEAIERSTIEKTLARTGQNKAKAARLLGLSRKKLCTRIQRLGLESPAEMFA